MGEGRPTRAFEQRALVESGGIQGELGQFVASGLVVRSSTQATAEAPVAIWAAVSAALHGFPAQVFGVCVAGGLTSKDADADPADTPREAALRMPSSNVKPPA